MTETVTTESAAARRTKKVEQVRSLMDLAEHPNTSPEEAAAAREKADELMTKYAIEEQEYRDAGLVETEDPIVREVWLYTPGEQVGTVSMAMEYEQIFMTLARLARVKSHYGLIRYIGSKDAEADTTKYPMGPGRYAGVAGFPADIDYLEMLYMQVRMHFIAELEPNVDGMERGAAVRALRKAGMTFPDITAKFLNADPDEYTYGYGRSRYGRKPSKEQIVELVWKPYLRECKRLGEKPEKIANAESYRQSLGDGFTLELGQRVYKIEMHRRQQMKKYQEDRGDGASLALQDRDEEAVLAFYDAYPHLRPKPQGDSDPKAKTWAETIRDCKKCQRSKRGRCRDHYVPKGNLRYIPVDENAREAGRAAAQRIDLGQDRVGGKRGELA